MLQSEFLVWLRGFLDGLSECTDWALETIEAKLESIKQPEYEVAELREMGPIKIDGAEAFKEIKPEVEKMIQEKVEAGVAKMLAEVIDIGLLPKVTKRGGGEEFVCDGAPHPDMLTGYGDND